MRILKNDTEAKCCSYANNCPNNGDRYTNNKYNHWLAHVDKFMMALSWQQVQEVWLLHLNIKVLHVEFQIIYVNKTGWLNTNPLPNVNTKCERPNMKFSYEILFFQIDLQYNRWNVVLVRCNTGGGMQPCFTQRIQQRELCYGHERESITRFACKKLVRAVPFDVILGDNIDNGYCFMYV